MGGQEKRNASSCGCGQPMREKAFAPRIWVPYESVRLHLGSRTPLCTVYVHMPFGTHAARVLWKRGQEPHASMSSPPFFSGVRGFSALPLPSPFPFRHPANRILSSLPDLKGRGFADKSRTPSRIDRVTTTRPTHPPTHILLPHLLPTGHGGARATRPHTQEDTLHVVFGPPLAASLA